MARVWNWLDAVKAFAKDYVLENTGLKILALLITAVLWLSVASRPVSDVTLNNVPIVFNLPDSPDLIVSKSDTLTARVALRGPRDVLDALRPSDLAVIADMSEVEPGVRVIQLQLDRGRLPSSVQERSVEPRAIRVTLEHVAERYVPIRPRFEGEPPPGYVVHWEVEPPSVHIKGLASQVRDITEVSTETVSLTGKVGQFTEEVAIDIGYPNVSVSQEDPDKVQLKVTIEEPQKERVVDHLPVSLIGAPPSARVAPRHVRVTLVGPGSLIEEITPADVRVTVDYDKGSRAEPGRPRELTPSVSLARYADRISVRQVEPRVVRVR